jgi:hypothetical protein
MALARLRRTAPAPPTISPTSFVPEHGRKNMTESNKDLGVATVVLERFTSERLPRALALKEKVDRGEKLDDRDLKFLHEVFTTARQIEYMVERHPEYQEIYAQATQLYKEITEKALENEKGSSG